MEINGGKPTSSYHNARYDSLAIIAFEFPPFPGGISTYAEKIAQTVSRTHSVVVIAPHYGEKASIDQQLPIYRALKHQTLGLWGASQALRKLAHVEKGTLLHCADIRSGLIGLLAHMLYGHPYTVMVHGSEVLKLNPKRPDFLLLKSIYNRAERIVANSSATASSLGDRIDGLRECVVAHLGVDADWFDEPPVAFTSPMLSGIGSNDIVFCTLGRLEPRKGHLSALEAVDQYQRMSGLTNIKYVIAGKTIDADYEREIRAAASGLPFEVLLTGPLSKGDARRLFRIAQCQLLLAASVPGKVEGFGLVILEAAAQGCPTVATRVGGIPEVIQNGMTGCVVDEGDTRAAALAIDQIRHASESSSMRLNCRASAQTFTWSKCARRSFDGLLSFD